MIDRMYKEYASLRRRTFLAPVWLFALAGFAGLALLVWAVTAASTTIIVVMRHAEKVADGTDDPALSAAGVERAGRIAAIFGAHGRDGTVDAIFVSQYQRSAATARPLAVETGVPVVTVPADDLRELERRIFDGYRGRRVLVVAHSDSVPEIVRRLSGQSRVAPIAADEYGTVYVIAIPRWGHPALLRVTLP
jgi:broad specificity phosphatase PhoE